jgi:mono/diheme cytochrome c family protein
MIPAIQIKIALAAVLLVLLSLGIFLGGKAKLHNAAMVAIYSLSFVAVVALGYFGATLVYGGFSPAASQASSASAPAGYAQGQALFAANCQACHQGGGNSIVASLPVKGSKRLASLEAFDRFLRAPTMPDGKGGDMPAYGTDALTAAQVKDLYSYTSTDFK